MQALARSAPGQPGGCMQPELCASSAARTSLPGPAVGCPACVARQRLGGGLGLSGVVHPVLQGGAQGTATHATLSGTSVCSCGQACLLASCT